VDGLRGGVRRTARSVSVAGSSGTFATIAEGVLHSMFVQHAPNRNAQAAVQHVLDGFSSVHVHPDVPTGVRALAASGLRLVTLTNGATSVGEALLTNAGVLDQFERLLSVDDASRWKPAPESYAYAARECEVSPAEMMLVAVHPWDIDGAARAGLQTAWIDRSGTAPYPPYLTKPDVTVPGVDDLAHKLVEYQPVDR